MKKILILIVLLHTIVNSDAQKAIVLDGHFSYLINLKNEHDAEMLKKLQNYNPQLIDVRYIKTKNKTIVFSASRYEGAENMPMKIVLEKYVNSVKATPTSKIIETKTYIKNGKTYYKKVTSAEYIKGTKTITIMYYFKESDKSEYLYELKITADKTTLKEYNRILENIAGTVTFIK